MSSIGRINKEPGTTSEYITTRTINDLGRNDFGNGGLTKKSIDFLYKNLPLIEMAFRTADSLYILPKTHEFARDLFVVMRGEQPDPEREPDYWSAEADEVSWDLVDGRYWLTLWWD